MWKIDKTLHLIHWKSRRQLTHHQTDRKKDMLKIDMSSKLFWFFRWANSCDYSTLESAEFPWIRWIMYWFVHGKRYQHFLFSALLPNRGSSSILFINFYDYFLKTKRQNSRLKLLNGNKNIFPWNLSFLRSFELRIARFQIKHPHKPFCIIWNLSVHILKMTLVPFNVKKNLKTFDSRLWEKLHLYYRANFNE